MIIEQKTAQYKGFTIEATRNITGHEIRASAEIGPKPVIIKGHIRGASAEIQPKISQY